MAKHYVTFGSIHIHNINGKILDQNVVARYDANTILEGRAKAFELFGRKFAFEYYETEWKEDEQMKHFLGGYVDIEENDKPITKEEAIARLEQCIVNTDIEASHVEADTILCELLESLGYKEVVDKWDKVKKWYA